ncbi:phosphoglycolate phosphatase, partial [Francisella tularensis subsp. holarctica]|nr:phosphoglycolate phosphatase [Francisella tularensis subsp. holarctica]
VRVCYGYQNRIDLKSLETFAYIDDFSTLKNLI